MIYITTFAVHPYLLSFETVLRAQFEWAKWRKPSLRIDTNEIKSKPPTLNLLLSCKQVHSEAFEYYYQHSRIEFDYDTCYTWVVSRIAQMPIKQLQVAPSIALRATVSAPGYKFMHEYNGWFLEQAVFDGIKSELEEQKVEVRDGIIRVVVHHIEFVSAERAQYTISLRY